MSWTNIPPAYQQRLAEKQKKILFLIRFKTKTLYGVPAIFRSYVVSETEPPTPVPYTGPGLWGKSPWGTSHWGRQFKS